MKVTITVPRDLAIRTRLRPISHWHGFTTYLPFYGWRFGLFVGIVLIIDAFVPPMHHQQGFVIAAIVFVAVCMAHDYVGWLRGVQEHTTEFSYVAELDDAGVTFTTPQSTETVPWSTYLGCNEQSDALEIWMADGGCSYVPKTAETAEAIAFTKTRMPPYDPRISRRPPSAPAAGIRKE